jgi:hypothetical protein
MKLRDHPALSYHGIHTWPPLWSPAKAPQDTNTLRGEIGTLKFSHATPETRQCYLVIEHNGIRYVGCVFCSDTKFCSQIASVLAHSQNRTIEQIGDMDLRTL